MQPRILNVDILDDKEPTVYVQKHIYSDRTFQVFRKSTGPDERFELSPGIKIDPDLFWDVSIILFDTADEFEEDDLREIFAVVYSDEDNPPRYDPEAHNQAEPYLSIAYDPNVQRYCCEPATMDFDDLESIAAPTLDEAIACAVDGLYAALAKGEGR